MPAPSRSADIRPSKMLRDGRKSALVKLQRGIGVVGGSRLWADHVDAALAFARGRILLKNPFLIES